MPPPMTSRSKASDCSAWMARSLGSTRAAGYSALPERSQLRTGAAASGLVAALLVPQIEHDPIHLRRGLVIRRATGRSTAIADPDLQMRAGGDAHRATPDVGDRLAGADVLADPDQRRGGVAVVDVAALVLAAVHLDDRRVRAKPVDALLHDGAGGHRHLDGAAATGRTLGGDVHALVERPGAGAEDHAERPDREHPAAAAGARGRTAARGVDPAALGGLLDQPQQLGGGAAAHVAGGRPPGVRV